jgi:hypothetical protein
MKTKNELSEDLCNYCPLATDKRKVYSVHGGCVAGCEGSECDVAYENYVESITNNPLQCGEDNKIN